MPARAAGRRGAGHRTAGEGRLRSRRRAHQGGRGVRAAPRPRRRAAREGAHRQGRVRGGAAHGGGPADARHPRRAAAARAARHLLGEDHAVGERYGTVGAPGARRGGAVRRRGRADGALRRSRRPRDGGSPDALAATVRGLAAAEYVAALASAASRSASPSACAGSRRRWRRGRRRAAGGSFPTRRCSASWGPSARSPASSRARFDPAFLELPREVLASSLRDHQSALTVERDGVMLPVFLTVMDRPDDPIGRVRAGNEWVVAARLADARFFWQEDRRAPLADRVATLAAPRSTRSWAATPPRPSACSPRRRGRAPSAGTARRRRPRAPRGCSRPTS